MVTQNKHKLKPVPFTLYNDGRRNASDLFLQPRDPHEAEWPDAEGLLENLVGSGSDPLCIQGTEPRP